MTVAVKRGNEIQQIAYKDTKRTKGATRRKFFRKNSY